MTNSQRNLAATFLKQYSDDLGNNGCNDYDMPNTPENYQFVKDMLKWNNGRDEIPRLSPDGETIYTQDFFIASYLADLLIKETK